VNSDYATVATASTKSTTATRDTIISSSSGTSNIVRPIRQRIQEACCYHRDIVANMMEQQQGTNNLDDNNDDDNYYYVRKQMTNMTSSMDDMNLLDIDHNMNDKKMNGDNTIQSNIDNLMGYVQLWEWHGARDPSPIP
jgi:hypothetical protein